MIRLERNPSLRSDNCIRKRKAVETGIAPYINTAIAHKEMGHGLIGISLARAPMDCFIRALKALANKFG